MVKKLPQRGAGIGPPGLFAIHAICKRNTTQEQLSVGPGTGEVISDQQGPTNNQGTGTLIPRDTGYGQYWGVGWNPPFTPTTL